MTQEEYAWLKRAIDALDDPSTTRMARIKILKIMSQICDKSAKNLESSHNDVDEFLAEYQKMIDKLP